MNSQMLMGFALSVSSDTKYTAFSLDSLIKAAEVTLLGLGMVFLVLAILWGVLAIFKVVFAGEPKPKKEAVKEAPVAPQEPAVVETAQDDGELIAVITAAIEAYRASESNGDADYAGGFRVVSFRRAGAGRPWDSNK